MTRYRAAEVRAARRDRPGVTLKVVQAHVLDDYNTVFEPDAFDASLARRKPVLCWSHQWHEPLGPCVGWRSTSTGPEIDFEFSDFDDVPAARRAWSQVKDGTIVDCSVGFSNTRRRDPTPSEEDLWPGVQEIIVAADLDEVSLVLRGAVPGAKVLAVRRPALTVDAAVAAVRGGLPPHQTVPTRRGISVELAVDLAVRLVHDDDRLQRRERAAIHTVLDHYLTSRRR